MSLYPIIAIVVLVIFFLSAALRILNEYERGVIFCLGRVIGAKGPGLIILIPLIDKMVKVSLRLVAMDVDPQTLITDHHLEMVAEGPSLVVIPIDYRENDLLSQRLGEISCPI